MKQKENKKRKDVFYNLNILFKVNKSFFYSILKNNPMYYPFQAVLLIMEGVTPTVIALLPKLFVDSIVQGNTIYTSLTFIIALAVYNIINSLVHTLFLNYKQIVYEKARNESKIILLKNCKYLYHSYFDVASNHNLLHRAVAYSERGGEQFINVIWSLLTNIISITTIVLVFDAIKVWMVIWVLLLNGLRLTINRKTEKIKFDFSKERTIFDRKKGYLSSLLTGQPTLEELNVNDGFDKKTKDYMEVVEDGIMLTKGHNKKMFRWSSLLNCMSSLQTIVIYGYVGMGMVRGDFTLGDYTAILLSLSRVDLIINRLIDFPKQIFPQALEAENYFDFLNTPQIEKQPSVQICSIQTIEFDRVFFRYPGTNEYVLDNISFKLSSEKKYALVGVNGAGKSTLIKLILKFYLPTEGHIYVNGIDINRISRESLWSCIGYVPQNITLYSTNIYDNVDLANKNNIETVKAAIELVGLSKRIAPQDYFQSVSRMFDDKGVEFSIGERQKLSIARALIKNSTMFIFDEPTSALDAESEFEILEALWRITQERLTIIISHRLSCVKKADQIIFINDRKINNIASHTDLMELCCEYRQMYQKQASQYVDF